MPFSRPIFTSLSPNTEKDDILLALKLIFEPKGWKTGNVVQELEEEFKKYLGVKYAFAFNSGRSAFLAILDSLGIGEGEESKLSSSPTELPKEAKVRKRVESSFDFATAREGDEVLLQGFTCNSAVNPILKKGVKPIFVDIDDTLNLDPQELRKKITSRSKAVMVQHNFGWPAKMEEILEISKDNGLFVIEDCAHSLGAKFRGKFCGTFGDAAFFSFGRDKIISSVFGGMAITNDENLAKKIKEFQEKLNYPSNFWIFQQLLHPILTNYLVLPAYGLNSNFGRLLLGLFHKLSILSKAVYKKEKKGESCKYFPKKFPSAFAILALNQFMKLERFNKHRREIANFFQKELKNTNFTLPLAKAKENIKPTFMRYPILVNLDTDKILQKARKRKIYLNDGWRKTPIVPPDTNLEKMRYIKGSCPKAERVARSIVNLPTHINISQKNAQKITNFLKQLN